MLIRRRLDTLCGHFDGKKEKRRLVMQVNQPRYREQTINGQEICSHFGLFRSTILPGSTFTSIFRAYANLFLAFCIALYLLVCVTQYAVDHTVRLG